MFLLNSKAANANQMDTLDSKVSAYYDSLSDAAVREDSAWGQLGESALAQVELDEDLPPMGQVER